MVDIKLIFLALGLIISLSAAYYSLKVFDKTKENISTKKIIDSTQEKTPFVDKLSLHLSRLSFNKEETKNNLVRAGIHSEFIAQAYYLLKIIPLVFCLAFIGYSYIQGEMEFSSAFISFSLSMLVCLIAPDMYISSRGNANVRHVSSRLPFLLDLMNVCVHTGMTLEASLDYLSNELKTVDENLAYVVKKTSERAKIVGLDRALTEFYDLVPTTEAQSFVMTLTQSLKYGSSVGAVLASLASDIREINMLELEEKIGKMGAKMSIPMIAFIMIPIVVLIAAPGIMRMLG
ncbi:type II secretion system F family protein [Vibrio parahaemolyticus]|uniref:type II secretion system F family protein n=1 Tax=Vibrio parahaemolyticus TaxID=670 RepID=UPI0022B57ED1|nr:type II secretion system F family protein [Vibrio parahaemolyticus]MCZ6358992.1 type II secretion system F family protein [Vibrio parahaemolyticus]MCZ6363553.1 type II secretion system F family protein [Vibrio parahaemolyticus]